MRKGRREKGLYLVGTVHLDFDSAPTLMRLLEDLEPCGVTVEISRFSVEYREKMEAVWLARLAEIQRSRPHIGTHYRIELLRRQLSMPFEWRVAKGFCGPRQIPCIPVDWGGLAKAELPTWLSELVTPENLEALAAQPPLELHDYLESHRDRARRAFQRSLQVRAPWSDSPSWERREKILTKRVETLLKRFERLVHIGGWSHVVPSFSNNMASGLLSVLKGVFLVLPDEILEYGH